MTSKYLSSNENICIIQEQSGIEGSNLDFGDRSCAILIEEERTITCVVNKSLTICSGCCTDRKFISSDRRTSN
ncbi:hypothetical protein [Nostoc sp.]|uniref:hypothetical protein n=1 Tax=Nostoc sp. TaxID=1180 RepID=UPI002FFB8F90